MRILQIFVISLMILFASSCKVEYDIRKPFSEMLEVPKLIPYQSTSFKGSNFPGVIADYKIFFGDLEVPVTKVSPDSISIFVPFEARIGEWDVDLIYKGEKTRFGRVEILDWKTVVPGGITYFKGDDPEFPYSIVDENSNQILPHFENGAIDKIYINGRSGSSSVLEVNDSGLPVFFYNEKVSVVFDGYDLEKGTVNVAHFPTGLPDSVKFDYGIPLNKESLVALKGYKNGRIRGEDTQQAFAIVGTVFSITGCIVGLIPPLAVITGGLALISCGSAVYDAWKMIDPDVDNTFASTSLSVYGISTNLFNCLNLVTKPKNAVDLYEGVYGCYGLALEAANGVDVFYTEYKKTLEREIKKMQDILATGYGDIKITLEWNNETDIDLWVVEPNGTKIYFEEPDSPTLGQLDLDNTDGYGPENVFWPIDKAPLGNYKVQVHYYGPEGGPTARYLVTIMNFGRTKSFRGNISYNQIVTIADFKSNEEWRGAGGRLSVEIVTADRSTLPIKKRSLK